ARDDAPILHHDRAEWPASPRADIVHRPLDRFPHEGGAHTTICAPSAHSANCTGKADPAVCSFVMRPIGIMHCDLRLDFRKFVCKMFSLACVSAGNRVIGCVKVTANTSGLGPAPAAILMPFIPGVRSEERR